MLTHLSYLFKANDCDCRTSYHEADANNEEHVEDFVLEGAFWKSPVRNLESNKSFFSLLTFLFIRVTITYHKLLVSKILILTKFTKWWAISTFAGNLQPFLNKTKDMEIRTNSGLT